MPESVAVGDLIAAQRPRRADAARNFDALLAAAREAFAEHGADASLEDIARRAGVGIGTLYRNFPTRRHLFEAVYANEVNDLARTAQELSGEPPWEALAGWLRRFVAYTVTKRAIREALEGEETDVFTACRQSMYDSVEPLFARAQEAGEVRKDMSVEDLLRLVAGINSIVFADDEQRERVLGIALDGVRAGR
ncbi:TetR/AcrR family transcriptional regulator [Kitasatospora sp. NPDC057015]|uniref:TetR/AcrR family transcriptional regulator n=1 Tax=Kitasatospora sp. NPDC057015 TaxID=3346001 RepID=UPI00362BCE20